MKIHWSAVAEMLNPYPDDDEMRKQLMRQYRDEGGIAGYWLCDPAKCNADGDCWDEYHQEWREPWQCGPTPNEIDWSNLDKSIMMDKTGAETRIEPPYAIQEDEDGHYVIKPIPGQIVADIAFLGDRRKELDIAHKLALGATCLEHYCAMGGHYYLLASLLQTAHQHVEHTGDEADHCSICDALSKSAAFIEQWEKNIEYINHEKERSNLYEPESENH